MFSSSIVRRGPSSIAKPRCSSIGLGQLCTTAAAGEAARTRGAYRRQVATFRVATIGQSKQASASAATGTAGYGSRLVLETEPASAVGHRRVSRSRCTPLQQPRTFGGGATAAVHARGLLKGGQSHRWFATARDEPADTDTGPDSSERESEFEYTIFGAAALQPAATAASAAAAAVEEPLAKKKTAKSRNPRKWRTSSSKSTPSADPSAADAAAALAAAVETPAAAEATATKKPPKARKPRNRRTTEAKGNGTPSPPAGPAKGTATATGSEEKEEEEEEEAEPAVGIPKSRKAAFERARRAGVIQRAREGGGVGGSGSPSSDEEEEQDSDDDDDGHDSSPSSWQDPARPVRPEGFSFSTEGSTNAAKRRTQRRKRAQQEQHPVLGRFVADLKYKRVYVTSIDALMQAPVWEKARTLRQVHAAEIFYSQKLEADKLEIQMIEAGEIEAIGDMDKQAKGLPGVITLFKRPVQPGKRPKYTLGILDGQHRLGALLLLAKEGLWDRFEQNVVVEVFDTKDDEEIEKLFLDINKAEPIELDLGHPRAEDAQKCADEVVLHLFNEFRPLFRAKGSRPPSLHAATFKENLVNSGMIERHDLFDPQLLLDYLLQVNKMLSERDMQMWEHMIGHENGLYRTRTTLLAALDKARLHKFWLGMELSWMLV